jgi:rhomboid family GlyGly-CTERM serine protease
MRPALQAIFRIALRTAWLPLSVAAVSSYALLVPGTLLHYDRHAVLAGQWWRLLTAHLVHGSITHLVYNIIALALILHVFGRHISPLRLGVSTLLLMLTVGGGLLLCNADLAWYVGFSGVLHGLFALLALQQLLTGSRAHTLALAALGAKIAYEQLLGPSPASELALGLPVIVDAHLYGAASGIVLALSYHGLIDRRSVPCSTEAALSRA